MAVAQKDLKHRLLEVLIFLHSSW